MNLRDRLVDPNSPDRRPRKAAYALPTLFTAGNIFLGYISILRSFKGAMLAASGAAGASDHFEIAAKAIGAAVFLDGLWTIPRQKFQSRNRLGLMNGVRAYAVCAMKTSAPTTARTASIVISEESNQSRCCPRSIMSCALLMHTANAMKPTIPKRPEVPIS